MGSQSSAVVSEPTQDLAPTIRVLLDARKLGDGGIGVYIENTINGLLDTSGISLTLLGRPDVICRYDFSNKVSVLPDLSAPHSIDALFKLSSRIPWNRFDIYHSPHFIMPRGVPIPYVVTIHDLIHITSPERFYYPWIATPLIRSAIKNASKIVTVSETSKKEMLDVFGQDLEGRITVIPNALRESLENLSRSPEALSPVKSLPSRYILAVASNLKPHKGIRDLIDAFTEVTLTTGESLSLVIVGIGVKKSERSNNHVIELGKVDDETLARLYANALALVVPSRVEGFCLPVIEAHAFGTPVVSRPVPAVLELLAPEDEVASSFSVPALSHAIKAVVSNPRRVRNRLPKRYERGTAAKMISDLYRSTARDNSISSLSIFSLFISSLAAKE